MFYLPVCPTGFEWFDQNGCVALVTTPASKANAITQCQTLNPSANLVMPKTGYNQMKLQQFLLGKTTTKMNMFLGMGNVDGKWLWDDGSPVFVRCKSKS